MRLTLLGTGSPMPSLRRASTGNLVQFFGHTILVDCGPGAARRLVEAGTDPTSITEIVLTHFHFDHVGDLATILFWWWDRRGGLADPPAIIGPIGTQTLVDRLLSDVGAFAPDLTARTSHPRSLEIYRNRGGEGARPWPSFPVREVGDGDVLQRNGYTLTFAEVLHHQPYLMSLGVRIDSEQKVVAISSDVTVDSGARYGRSVGFLCQRADALVHYLNHLPMDGPDKRREKELTISSMAERQGVRKLITTHHGPAMDRDEDYGTVARGLSAGFSGEVIIGEDLLSIDL